METKICNRCGIEKELESFSISSRISKRSGFCRACNSERTKKYVLDRPWFKTYKRVYSRCLDEKNASYERYGGAGIELLMKPEDFKYLYFRDGAQNMVAPRIHRKNRKGNYTMENCEYIEKKRHEELHTKQRQLENILK